MKIYSWIGPDGKIRWSDSTPTSAGYAVASKCVAQHGTYGFIATGAGDGWILSQNLGYIIEYCFGGK
jgi:hypothetical protein